MHSILKKLLPGSLATQLALAFSLLSIVLTVALVALVERRAIDEAENAIGQGLADLAAQTSDKLERGMFERYREVALLAAQPGLTDPGTDPARLARALARVQQSYSYYEWLGIVGLDGKVLASGNGLLAGVDVSARPWFREGLRDGYVGDVHEALLLARLLPPQEGARRFVDLAFPFADAGGKVHGVLGAHLSWNWAREVERSVVGSVARRSPVETLILDRTGRVLLGPEALVDKRLAQPSLYRAATRREGGFLVERWRDGKDYVVGYQQGNGYANYRGLGWTVLVRQDVGSAYAPVRDTRRYLLWSGAAMALLFSLAGMALARRITRPLERLASSASALKDGALTLPPEAGGYEEVTALRRSLGTLVSDLDARRGQLQQLNGTLEVLVEARTQELRGALEKVQASDARIRAIVDAAQDAFIAADLAGRIKEWNAQAEAMLGWRRDEAIGRSLVELMLPERFRPSETAQVVAYLESGRQGALGARVERVVTDRHGLEIPVEMSTSLTGAGETATFSIFLRDIAERKRIDRMKNEFVGTVSHELRTPLTSIRASLALLADGALGELPADVQEVIEICNNNCQRLNRLVDDMLDIQKIEAGMMSFAPRTQPLLPLAREAIRTMRAMATAKEVTLVLDSADGGDDLSATFDLDRMTQVLINLLSNAIKAAPAGSAVMLFLASVQGGARLSVSDRGPGIPAAQRERVFMPFVQIGSGGGGGTGLGLAICKRIVEEHGGGITVGDAPGGGALFHVTLPRAPQGGSRPAAGPASLAGSGAQGVSGSIAR